MKIAWTRAETRATGYYQPNAGVTTGRGRPERIHPDRFIGQLRSVALAKPNFEYQKRQKELEKKRKKEEKLKRRQERHAVPADGEAPATPPADDSDPA